MTEWRVHLGAHKTATTHMQLTLATARPRINALGADFLPLESVRPLIAALDHGRLSRRLVRRLPALGELFRRRKGTALREGLLRAARGTGPLAFSEENLLSGTHTCFRSGTLYPKLSRVGALSQLRRHAPMKVFVTLRALDGFLPSAYAQALKETRFSRQAFDDAVDAFASQTEHWTGLIARLRQILPDVAFEIWNFDDYRNHWQTFHRSLVGVDLDEFPEIPPPIETKTPGAAAVAAAEALETPSGPDRAPGVMALYAHDIQNAASARFEPLDVVQKAHFRRLYAADLAALQDRFPGILRTF